MVHCCAECALQGALVSRHARRVCSSGTAMLHVKKSLAEAQENMQTTCCRATRYEALFKEPPPKEDCPICFLPMPYKLISCISLPPATITSVPINDYADTHEELAGKANIMNVVGRAFV
jgi:hypothetical protein